MHRNRKRDRVPVLVNDALIRLPGPSRIPICLFPEPKTSDGPRTDTTTWTLGNGRSRPRRTFSQTTGRLHVDPVYITCTNASHFLPPKKEQETKKGWIDHDHPRDPDPHAFELASFVPASCMPAFHDDGAILYRSWALVGVSQALTDHPTAITTRFDLVSSESLTFARLDTRTSLCASRRLDVPRSELEQTPQNPSRLPSAAYAHRFETSMVPYHFPPFVFFFFLAWSNQPATIKQTLRTWAPL